MRTVTEYRPGRWALLEAGAVVMTTTDPHEAAAWAPRADLPNPGPLFAGLASPAPLVPNLARQAAQDPAPMSRDIQPAWLWLSVDGGGAPFWRDALAIWQRRAPGQDLPQRIRARPATLGLVQEAAPSGVTCEPWAAVLPQTAWLGPLPANEATP